MPTRSSRNLRNSWDKGVFCAPSMSLTDIVQDYMSIPDKSILYVLFLVLGVVNEIVGGVISQDGSISLWCALISTLFCTASMTHTTC